MVRKREAMMSGTDSTSSDENRGDKGGEPSMNGVQHDVDPVHPIDRELSDEELMNRLACGRREALGLLHDRYGSLIQGLAARSLGPESAEEIGQEIFLAVWKHATAFDPARGSFRTWVLQITRRRVINELRRRARRPRTRSRPTRIGDASPPDPGPGPEEEVCLANRRDAVRAAVDALPAPQREALSLAFLEDLTHEQVAALLNVPLGTTKSRIRAGVRILRTRLAPLVAAGLIVGSLIVAGSHETEQQLNLRRKDRALRLVTNSEVVPRRLGPAPGINPAAHGNYRGRSGVDLAVLTLSYLDTPPSGFEYRAWAAHQGRWTFLGRVRLEGDGRSLIIAEGPELRLLPDQVQVTLEPIDQPAGDGSAPDGPPVVLWPDR
jgi:RNA polymerase sigma factor (sigma-70 family)